MKKYILTIVYDDTGDTVEWLQEEVESVEVIDDITLDDISKLTSEDIEIMMETKEYAKA